jgi:hypothetical protein
MVIDGRFTHPQFFGHGSERSNARLDSGDLLGGQTFVFAGVAHIALLLQTR